MMGSVKEAREGGKRIEDGGERIDTPSEIASHPLFSVLCLLPH